MVMFRYYLLGGDTAAPSGLYARLSHAFLVSFNIVVLLRILQYFVTKRIENNNISYVYCS